MQQKITPHLWFDKEAKEAAELYTSAFEDSRIKDVTVLHNTPSGSVDIVTIELAGQELTLLNAGPLFKFTPAISFFVACQSKEEVDAEAISLMVHCDDQAEIDRYWDALSAVPEAEVCGW